MMNPIFNARSAAAVILTAMPTTSAFATDIVLSQFETTDPNTSGQNIQFSDVGRPRPSGFFNIRTTMEGVVIEERARFVSVDTAYPNSLASDLGYETVPNVYFTSMLEYDDVSVVTTDGALKLNIPIGQSLVITAYEQPESYDLLITDNVGYKPDTVTAMGFTFHPADTNFDGTIDLRDLVKFIQDFQTMPATYWSIEPGSEPRNVDFNLDGIVNEGDLLDFIDIYQNPTLLPRP